MRTYHGIHWFAPGSMLASLLAGILLAIGHHLFYQSLDGTAASTIDIIGTDLSRQQASIAVGTALAFLVKACLVYAVTVAYIQVFWKEAKARNAAPTLSTLDSISSAVNDLRVLFNLPLWLSCYLLLLLGTIAWWVPNLPVGGKDVLTRPRLLPIASIITPATLTTQLAPVVPLDVGMRSVPNLDFRSFSFLDELRVSMPGVYTYSGPKYHLSNVAAAAMANGAILPIRPPAANASWDIDFFGPSIKCSPINDTLRLKIRQGLFYHMAGINGSYGNEFTLYGYMGWFPNLGDWRIPSSDGILGPNSPFYTNGEDQLSFRLGAFYHTFYLFAASRTMAENYMGQVTGTDWRTASNGTSLPAWLDGTMLECQLLNSSYHVHFNYTDNVQHIDARSSQDGVSETPISPYYQVIGPTFGDNSSFAPKCFRLSTEVTDTPSCVFDATILKVLSYQAVWDAFTSILRGSVSYTLTINRIRNSSIGDTALVNTPELSILRGIEGLPEQPGTLQQALAEYDDPGAQGLDNNYNDTWDMSLSTALEEMFRNVTMSLMSSPALLPNNDSMTAPGPVRVGFPANRIVYAYSPTKLWISYGIAILFTSITVVIGFLTLLQNEASYSNDFSTIFRMARGATLSTAIQPEDMSGHDPLPKYLEKAWVTLGPYSGSTATKAAQYQPLALDAPPDLPLQNLPPPNGAPQDNTPRHAPPQFAQTPPSQITAPQNLSRQSGTSQNVSSANTLRPNPGDHTWSALNARAK